MNSMIGYAEFHGHKKFDYREFLNRKSRRDYQPEEMRAVLCWAMSWHTCAIGQLSNSIPRNEAAFPLDVQLFHLGGSFGTIMLLMGKAFSREDDNSFEENKAKALEILNNIDSRLKQLENENEASDH